MLLDYKAVGVELLIPKIKHNVVLATPTEIIPALNANDTKNVSNMNAGVLPSSNSAANLSTLTPLTPVATKTVKVKNFLFSPQKDC